MSKFRSHIQTTSIGFVALLQLLLLPATHVLHLGCEHPEGHGAAHSSTLEDVISWCWSSSCCDHCEHSDETSSDPANPSNDHSSSDHQHDQHSCPVCHAAFAARLATTAPLAVPVSQLTTQYVSSYSESPQNVSRFDVQSRGPPQQIAVG